MSGLTREERANLRQFLADSFTLSELKTLCFDLGVDYELFPHETKNEFTRELISYFERKDNISCLVTEVIRQRPNDELVSVLSEIGSCSPRAKVQIVLSNDKLESKPNLLGELAKLLGVAPDEVMLIGTAAGSIKALISLPEEAADRLVDSPPDLIGGYYQVISITHFYQLPNLAQQSWRQAAFEGSPGSAGAVAASAGIAAGEVASTGSPLGLAVLIALIILGLGIVVVVVGGGVVFATWPRLAVENRCQNAFSLNVDDFLKEVGVDSNDLPVVFRSFRQIEIPSGEARTLPILYGNYEFEYDGTIVQISVPGFNQFDPVRVNPTYDVRFEEVTVFSVKNPEPVQIQEKAGIGSKYTIVLCPKESE